MKKAFAAFLILSMLLAAVAVAEAEDVTGIWYWTEIVIDGNSMSAADAGIEVSMELLEDGTVITHDSSTDDATGTWEIEGDSIIVDDGVNLSPLVFTLENGNLVSDIGNNYDIVYGREPGEVTTYEVVEAEAADFEGDWAASWVIMDGLKYHVSMLGIDLTLNVADGSFKLGMGSDTFGEPRSLSAEFADGAYSFVDDADEDNFNLLAQMLDDGSMQLTVDVGDQSLVFILNRVEAE